MNPAHPTLKRNLKPDSNNSPQTPPQLQTKILAKVLQHVFECKPSETPSDVIIEARLV